MSVPKTWKLVQEMGLTREAVERRKLFVGLGPDDAQRLAGARRLVEAELDQLASVFFDHLSGLAEARPLFERVELLQQARALKREHLIAMVAGSYGMEYVEQRLTLAHLYGSVGLEPRVFLGAFQHLLGALGGALLRAFEGDAASANQAHASLMKVAFLDIGIIVDALIFERERVIVDQQEAIRELSTPVLELRDRLLIIPMVGLVDTERARLLTQAMLGAIRERRAAGVVIDITGVPVVDSKVANHLAQACEAARLMGARVVLTGISSEVAVALVSVGAELGGVETAGNLKAGIASLEETAESHAFSAWGPVPGARHYLSSFSSRRLSFGTKSDIGPFSK